MDGIRIYWGGDLFDHKDLSGNVLLAEAVRQLSGGRYIPVLPQESEANKERTMDIRDSDYSLLLSCDAMLANFDGPDLDSGTVAEFMFAKMLDYPALLLRTDFRRQSESSSSPDPWNLMCSGFPRSKSLVIHAMEMMNLFRSDGTAWISSYHSAIAEKIISGLDEVCGMKPLFTPDELLSIYMNTLKATGGTLPEYWTRERITLLLSGKITRGIY